MNRPLAKQPAGGASIPAAHVSDRVGWLTSVRWRLQLITLLPMIGLAALTGIQAGTSSGVVADASRTRTLAATATATMELLHQLEREQAEAVALRDRGGRSGELLVTAQQARTDGALVAFRTMVRAAASAAPGLRPELDAAANELSHLVALRLTASPSASRSASGGVPKPTVDIRAQYAPVTAALLAVADAVPAQPVDRELANRTRALAALAAAKHALAGQRDLLRTVFRRHAFQADESAALIRLATTEQERLAAFERVAGADARAAFDKLVTGPDVTAATSLRDAALIGAAGAPVVDSDAWYVAATHTIRWLHELELTLAEDLASQAERARNGALRNGIVTIAGSVSVAVAAVVIATVIASRTSRRLGRLRGEALRSAHRLPMVVDEITAAADPVLVRDSHLAGAGGAGGELFAGPRDEIRQVASAFGVVHAAALRLAADQALLRLDTEALVIALARRTQKLVQQQLRAIDELERTETDPDALATFYYIDHLAARMRRNDENLLVLSGAEPGRRFTGTFPLLDVVRAASAEIADYPRVDAADLPDVMVAGHAVGDLVHLLAELLENAATFSPPHTRVTVTARHTIDGVLLAVYDDGIGMTAVDLIAVNVRLAGPTTLTSALAGTLGLLVVARLAARHGIGVELRSRDGTGTTALVALPAGILADPDRTPTAPLTTSAWRRAQGSAPMSASTSTPSPVRHPVPTAAIEAHAVIYDELISAWFGHRGTGNGTANADPWRSPGDTERAYVEQVLVRAVNGVTGAGLPRRQEGAQLLPGSVPGGVSQPRNTIDPEQIRTGLASLSRGFAAARAAHPTTDHVGWTIR